MRGLTRLKLRYVRKEHGYTYQQMASKLGITKSYYWQIENGKRGLSYENAIRIAKIFHRKPDDIFLPENNHVSRLASDD
ncbi:MULTISPECIES: helix-turn-helix transcriptional regulator [Bacillaceae]|uniref:helix-turn-helix transcriptional regulator n=1 Tax=unclassified Niallia TaxID=2837522 RepID=UPI00288B204F|nr:MULTISPECIES: helix-turn-helix transcriptional regulator [Bacillaceae]